MLKVLCKGEQHQQMNTESNRDLRWFFMLVCHL